MKMQIKLQKNTKTWETMRRNLSGGANQTSQIGWWNSIHPTAGEPIAQIAKWNEEGHLTGKGSAIPGAWVPPRPFMRKGFIPEARKLLPKYLTMFDLVAKGSMNWKTLNTHIGNSLRGVLQDVIEGWSTPPNSRTTISIKGKNDPLVDTGAMLNTVQSRVVKR